MSTPTLVQHLAYAFNVYFNTGTITLWLTNPTQPGNLLIFGISCNPGNSLTVTDNKSGTWTTGVTNNGNQQNATFYQMNAAGGIIKLTITGVTTGAVGLVFSEYYNIATSSALRTSSTATPVGNPLTAGSVTPTAGDLIWYWAQDTGVSLSTNTTGFTAGAGMTKLSSQRMSPQLVQHGIAAGGAVAPTANVTGGNADNFQIVTLVFASATAGQQNPAPMRVQMVQQDWLPIASPAGLYTYDFPTQGNLQVIQCIGEGGANTYLTGVRDNGANTWSQVGAPVILSPLATQQQWYSNNTSANSNSRTVSVALNAVTSATYESIFYMYDVVGAATAPYDVSANTAGTQSTNADLSTVTLTPSTTGGLVFFLVAIDSHTLSGMTSNTTYSSTFPVGSGQDGNSDTWAMTNGFGVVNAAPQSALTAVWTVQGNGVPAGVGGWAASAVAFKSANFARLRFRIMC